jgi:Ca2+-binding RTX toxin-like protein
VYFIPIAPHWLSIRFPSHFMSSDRVKPMFLTPWLRSVRSRLSSSKKRERRRTSKNADTFVAIARPNVEALEDRTLLSTITWTNRGDAFNDTDGFVAAFGPANNLARQVVDASISQLEIIYDQFNRPSRNNELNVDISMDIFPGFGGSTAEFDDVTGYPTIAQVLLERGDFSGPTSGYFLDPTPLDSTEFLGSITSAYTGVAPVGGDADGLVDFYSLITHELTHALGLNGAFTNRLTANPLNGSSVNANIADDALGGGNGNYFVFDGPSVTHLMSANDDGVAGVDRGAITHSAGIGGVAQPISFNSDFRGTLQLEGATDLLNVAEGLPPGVRTITPDYLALILQDAYGYTITAPSEMGTFYAMQNEATGEVVINGGPGASDDVFTLSRDGDDLVVSVDVGIDTAATGPDGDDRNLPAFVSRFDSATVTSIRLTAGDGDDTINFDLSGGNPLPDSPLNLIEGGGQNDVINVTGSATTIDHGFGNPFAPSGNTLDDAVDSGLGLDVGAIVTITNGMGDGNLSVPGLNALGTFTDANYDPLGTPMSMDTVGDSKVYFRSGTLGMRDTLDNLAMGVSTIRSTGSEANSTFTVGNLSFQLTQTVETTFDALGIQNGSLLTQTYNFVNTGTMTENFEFVRYLDSQLEFDGSMMLDGGGRLNVPTGEEVIYATDTGGTSRSPTNYIGVTGQNGTAPVANRFEIEDLTVLEPDIILGIALDDMVLGDGDGDEFVDPGSEFDLVLGVRNLFTVAPGASDVYTTHTLFGSGTPVNPTTPRTNTGTFAVESNRILYSGITSVTDTASALTKGFDYHGIDITAVFNDDANPGDGFSEATEQSAEGTLVTYLEPSTNLNVRLGTGNDDFNVIAFDSTAASILTFSGNDGNDTLDGSTLARAVRLNGGMGNDVITGSVFDDTVTGNEGDDVIDGAAGSDLISETGDVDFTLTDVSLTGLGMDTLMSIEIGELTGGMSSNTIDAIGFAGETTLSGLQGDDQLFGGSSGDELDGGVGDDLINGNNGNDRILDSPGADTLNGNNGADTIFSGLGNDSVVGGLGQDDITINFDNGDIEVEGGADADFIRFADAVSGGTGSISILAEDALDSIFGAPIIGTPVTIDGGNPPFPTNPGDLLSVSILDPALVNPTVTDGGDGTGSVTSDSHATVSWTDIEVLTILNNPNLSFDADEAIPLGGDGADSGDTDNFRIVRTGAFASLEVDGITVAQFPVVGVASVSLAGSGDDDFLDVDETGGLIPFAVNFDGGAQLTRDVIRVTGFTGADVGSYQPSKTTLGNGQLSVMGNAINFTGVDPAVEVTNFTSFTFGTSNSNDIVQIDAAMNLAGTGSALTVNGTSAGVLFTPLLSFGVDEVIFDLATADGGLSDDVVTITQGALAFDPLDVLSTLTVQTGDGNDTINLTEGEFDLPNGGLGGGTFNLDGGTSTDLVVMTSQVSALEPNVSYVLTTTSSDNGSLTATVGTNTSTVNLLNFAGEQANLLGNDSDNTFDLSGWDQLGVAIVIGGGGNDTLIGVSENTTWNITNAFMGAPSPDSGDAGGFQFSDIDNLVGGTANDNFVVENGVVFTGSIDGAAGSDSLDLSDFTSGKSIMLTGNFTNGFTGNSDVIQSAFNGIDGVIGGQSENDSLTGLDQDASWELDGTNTYTNTSSGQVLSFEAVEQLSGGLASDTFLIQGTRSHDLFGGAGADTFRFTQAFSQLVGSIVGDAGTDTIDMSQFTTQRNVFLNSTTGDGFSGTESSITAAFTGIDSVVGGLTSNNDNLFGIDADARWDITADDAGVHTDTTASVPLAFASIENLTGGSSVDTFSFGNQAVLSGRLDGAAGLDALIGDDARANESFIIDGPNTGLLLSGTTPLLSRFDNIETVVGAAGADSFTFSNSGTLDGSIDGVGGTDTIVGDNDGNIFNITSNDSGDLASKINLLSLVPNAFINVENLTGGSGVDTFNIGAPIVGTLDGRAGNDQFLFSNDGVVGASLIGGTGFDTLVGDDDGNLFTVTGNGVQQATGRGSLITKTDVFVDIETLVGGAGNDQFNFQRLGSIVGTVDGMGGDNTIVGDDDGNIFSVASLNSGLLFGKLTLFSDIQNLVGGAANDTVTVNARLDGDVSSLVGDDTILVGVNGIIGGDLDTGELNDTVDITGGRIEGNVDLGPQNDLLTLRDGSRVDGMVNGNLGDDTFDILGTVTMSTPLNGDGGNDSYIFRNAGTINVLLDGGADSDTIVGDDDGNAFTVTASNAGMLPEKAPAGFQFVENLTGGLAVDTFAINADLDGNITGGASNDTVTIAANQTVGGDIDGDSGNDMFTIADGSDVLGTIRGGSNDDSLMVDFQGGNTRTLTFDGGTNNDDIQLTGGGVGGTSIYNAGAATDEGSVVTSVTANTQTLNFSGTAPIQDMMNLDTLTINGTNQNNSFNVTDAAAGFTQVDFSGAFSEITFQNKTNVIINALDGTDTVNLNNPNPATGLMDLSVNGNGGNDSINVQVNHAGSVTGGSGNDTVTYSNGVQLDGSVDGNDGIDTINGQFFTTALDILLTSNDANGHTGSVAALMTGNFVGVDSIRGSSGADSLTGFGDPSTWDIDGTNQYTSGGQSLSFSLIENINGGMNNDTFNITGFQPVAVAGGAGDDALQFSNGAFLSGPFDGGTGTDTFSFAADTFGRTVTLTANVADGFAGNSSSLLSGGFTDVDSLTGGTANDTIVGQTIASTWEVDGTNRYFDATTTRAIEFSEFENLQGGAAGDTYDVIGNQTFNLLGGDGDDTVDFADMATLTGTIDGGNNSDVVDFQDYTVGVAANAGDYIRVEEIIGGNTLLDSLFGSAGNDTFNVTDTDEGTVNTIMFSDFENLLGQDGDDSFNLQFTGSLTGTIDGNSGSDALDVSTLVGGPHTVSLTALGATDGFVGNLASGNFGNIDSLSGTGADTLNGADQIATWTLDTNNSYAVGANSLSFGGFTSLNGGTLADTFDINASLAVELTGQGGDDTFNIADAATLTGNINGGDDADAFNLGNGATVTGVVDGEAGGDSLSFAPSTAAVSVTLDGPGLDGFDGSVANIGGGFDAINSVTGSGVGGDTLSGLDTDSNWAVGATSTYTDTVSTNAIDFSAFETLNGGAMVDTFGVTGSQTVSLIGNDGDDSFTLNSDDARITGSIDGGTGSNTLSFTGLMTVDADISLTDNAADGFGGSAGTLVTGGFSDIFTLNGGSGTTDTLTGQDVLSNWLVDPVNTYEDDVTTRVLTFDLFENLTGGSDGDTFTVRDALIGNISAGLFGDVVDVKSTGSIGGSITTEGGDDLVSIDDGATVGGMISTGSGADLLQIGYEGSNSRSFNVDIGSGDDELRLNGNDVTADVSYSVGPGATQGVLQTDIGINSQTITFDGADPSGSDLITDRQAGASISVDGSSAADTINVIDGLVDITFFTEVNFNGQFPELQFQSKPRASIDGGSNADVINLNNPNSATGIPGLELQFTNVSGGDGNDTINVLTDHSGDLAGNNGNDTFAFADGVTITNDAMTAGDPVDGGSGVDSLDLSGVTSNNGITLVTSGSVGFSGSLPSIIVGGNVFEGIDAITGGQSTDDLTGLNTDATWGIDGTNTYLDQTSGRLLSFTSVESLVGNNQDDEFQISGNQNVSITGLGGDDTFRFLTDDAAVTGFISGELGTDTLDFSALTSAAVNVALTLTGFIDGFDGNVGQIPGTFTDIDNIVGGGTANDSLTGLNALSGWTVSDIGSTYTSTARLLTFDDFETLTGGTNQDAFSIVGNPTADLNGGDNDDSFLFGDAAVLDGVIDGGAHVTGDMADFTNYLTPVAINVTQFVNVENINGGSTNDDTLLGSNGNDTINIDAPDAGSINSLPFVGFENIDGQAGDDSVTFTDNAATLTGSVDGNTGSDTLSFGGVMNAVDVTLTGLGLDNGYTGNDGAGAALVGFDNINTLIGNNPGTATLTGLDSDSTWTVAANGTYSGLGRSAGFSQFGELTGLDQADTFNVTESISININTGADDDVVNLSDDVTLTGSIAGNDDDDTVNLADNAVLAGSFDGAGGTDEINFSGNSLAQALMLTSATAGNGFDGSTATANYFDIESAVGGTSTADALTGLDNVSTWDITGSGDSYTDTVSGEVFSFTAFDDVNGGSAVDTFNVLFSATIDLFGNAANDVFNVSSNAVLTGELDGGANNDTFNFAGAINVPSTIDGGADIDSVDFSAGVTSVSIGLDNFQNVEVVTGTNLSDTIVGSSGNDTISVTANNNGSVNGTLTYIGFEHLQGAGGNDTFVLSNGFGVSGAIDGGADSDTLNYSAYSTSVNVDLAAGTATNIGTGISNVENATGGTVGDVLVGSSSNNVLNGGAGNDQLTDGMGDDNLSGGMGDDTFFLTPGSDDVVADTGGTDTLNFSLSAGPISIDLDDTAVQTVNGANTIDLDGTFENFVGTSNDDSVTAGDSVVRNIDLADGSSDTFITSNAGANAWQITGNDAGTLSNVTFLNAENLTGNTGNDTFTFADTASVSGTIDGSTGTDELDFSNYVTLGASVNLDNLVEIETLTGSAFTSDTINAKVAGSSFTINNGTPSDADGIAFTNFDNLNGGAGNDNFTFNSGATISSIDGAGGTNLLTLSGDNDAVTFNAAGSSVGYDGSVTGVTTFANVNSIDTGMGTDTLTGLNAVATWTLDGSTDNYTGSGRSATFTGVEALIGGSSIDTFNLSGTPTANLFGGAGADVFNLANGTQVNATIDGQADSDSLVFNGTTAETIALAAVGVVDGFSGSSTTVQTFDNVNVVQGGSGADTLQGTGVSATYNLNTTGNSYVEGATSLSFGGIETLNAGLNGDIFNVTGTHSTNINANAGTDLIQFQTNGSNLTGAVDAGDGTDIVDYSLLSASVTVGINDFMNVEVINGSQANDTLIGSTAGSMFNIQTPNSGNVDSTLSFTSFETLQGGAGNDAFTMSDEASISALIGSSGVDSLDLSAFSSARSVALTAGLADGFAGSDASIGTFTGIDNLTGSGQADSLTGVDANSTWDIGLDTYTTSSRTLNYTSFETLIGNGSRDIFNVTSNSTANLIGGAGDDSFSLADGVTLMGSANGGSGNDTVDLSSQSSAVAFGVDGVASDGFNVTASGFSGITIGSINNVVGSSNIDSLNGLSAPSTWTAGATDTYVSTNTLSASSIESRIGGTSSDSYAIQGDALPAGTTHSFLGGSGTDSFDINLAARASIDASTTLAINGGNPSSLNSDTVNINVNQSLDGVRNIGLTYQSAASGDADVSGLGGVIVDLDQVEVVNVNGDSANNDTLNVTGTAADDDITVVPSSNSANVFIGGTTDFVSPGVAGGSVGPDVSASGLVNAGGLSIDGAGGTINQLLYDGDGTITLTSPTSGTITQTGAVDVAFQNINDFTADDPIDVIIDAQTAGADGSSDSFVTQITGGNLELTVNGSTLISETPGDVKSLTINGSIDDDTLTINYANGNPIPTGGLTFNGNGETNGDDLIINGDSSNTGVYTPSSTTNGDGNVTIDGSSINFTGLEPVTVSDMASFTFVTPNGADVLTVDSPVAGQNRVSGTSGGIGFEALTFGNIGSFAIDAATNGGAGDNDSVTFSTDVTEATTLSVTTGQGDDTIDASNIVSIGLSIVGGAGNDNITGSALSDVLNAGSGTDTLNQSGSAQTLSDTQATGAGTDTISGFENAVVIGSAAAETIDTSGFTGSATIDALAGDDFIISGPGNDVLIGGGGFDNIQAGDGNDIVFGGSQADVIDGQGGNDQLFGQGSSSDFLTGGDGDDLLDGGAGNDRIVEIGDGGFTMTNTSLVGDGTDVIANTEHANLTAGAGNDTIDLTGFTNNIQSTLYGGEGNDLVLGSDGIEVVLGEGGNDTLIGNGANDTLLGSAGKDVLNGGDGNDFLRGQGASGDKLTGGLGDDILDGGAGGDFITETGDVDFVLTDGSLTGLGNDTIMNTEIVTLNGGASANTIDAAASSAVTFLNGFGGDDVITGGSSADFVNGGDGNDVISTGAGEDMIDGGAGDDTIDGGADTDLINITGDGTLSLTDSSSTGAGNDTFSNIEEAGLNGGAGNDVLDAGASTLRVFLSGNAGDDVLISGQGNDVLNGGDGNDQTQLTGTNIILTDTSFSGTGSDVVISIETIQLTAGATDSLLDASGYTGGNVTLIGGAGNDTLNGGSGNDSIVGNDGNDVINAGAGNDFVNGNNGSDMIDGGAGDDIVDGGGAADTVRGGDGNDAVRGGVGNDSLEGGSGNDFIEGENGFDTIRGGDGNDTLSGGRGNDVLLGEGGDDDIVGGDGEDGLNGGVGDDALIGDFGNDTLIGGDGNDNLLGGANDDILVGGDGDDYVRGNGGKDTLAGNAGVNTIVADFGEIDEAFTDGMFPELLI